MNSIHFEWKLDDEYYTLLSFCVNVTKAKEIIQNKPRQLQDFDIQDLAKWTKRPIIKPDGTMTMTIGHNVDWNKIDHGEVNLDFPLILATYKDELMLIDGWHRVAKAYDQGIHILPGVVLTEQETKKILL